jgi:hypothetical protein
MSNSQAYSNAKKRGSLQHKLKIVQKHHVKMVKNEKCSIHSKHTLMIPLANSMAWE